MTGYSGNGMIGTNFNLYRSGDLIAAVHDSTNYLDPSGTLTSVYYVCAVVDGQEVDRCADVTPGRVHTMNYLCENRLTVSRQLAKSIHTRQNDMSVGDVDGDGEYEYFVKWDPSMQRMYRIPATPVRYISTAISWTELSSTGLSLE